MKPSAPAIPLILGLSLLGASGAYLYMLFKKRRSNATGDLVDFFTRSTSKQDAPVAEIVIPNSLIPLVIGRKGYTLQHIQQSTGASINFVDHDESSQLCRIQGPSQAAVEKAKEMVLKETSRPITITEEVIVPQAACGKILGRCGDELQEICRKSMAKVWLEGRARSETERRVMITGTASQIKVAKELIAQKVREDHDSKKMLADPTRQTREPRIRTPPTSSAPTPVPSDGGMKLNTTSPKICVEKRNSSSFAAGQMEVFVSTIVSPSKFYVQLVGPQSTELDLLVLSMTEYYNQNQNRELHRLRKPYLGQIVAAEFNADNKWYRAEISAILPNEYKPGEVVLDLFFVDYGDNQYTNPNEVYELKPDFLALRFQAIECFLARVEPTQQSNLMPAPASATGEEEWDPVAVTRFEELTYVAQWKKIVSKIVTYRNSKSPLHGRETSPIPGVELYDTAPNGMDQINIAQQLIAEGLARPASSERLDELSRSQLFRLGLTNGTDGSSSQSSSIDKVDDVSASSSTSASTVISSGVHINGTGQTSPKVEQQQQQQQPQQSVRYRSLANGAH
uniref:tudor and KH domain-containing protein homolog n=1 Tax=Anopheles coluzzii TaxID=1518534 RepID=UPI001AACC3DC|nr:tudor and KH domain-containing protein homolog [Anopheles coluzzii]XP_040239903.1 tudor and KH domain-containing protein homolog [Anopheles coluzzii]